LFTFSGVTSWGGGDRITCYPIRGEKKVGEAGAVKKGDGFAPAVRLGWTFPVRMTLAAKPGEGRDPGKPDSAGKKRGNRLISCEKKEKDALWLTLPTARG